MLLDYIYIYMYELSLFIYLDVGKFLVKLLCSEGM